MAHKRLIYQIDKMSIIRKLQMILQKEVLIIKVFVFYFYTNQQLNILKIIQMINKQPILIGKLVKIRPMLWQDADNLYKVSSDKLIWQQHPEPQRSQQKFFKQNFFKAAMQSQGALIFQNLETQKIVGSSRYYNYRPAKKDIMIGYTFIARECWGSTYNREIKHLMMTHIYQWVDNIFFTVGQKNMRSRKAVEKIGGRLLSQEEIIKYELLISSLSVVFEIKKKDFQGLI